MGLDPKQIIEIRNLIKNLGKNHTVILSSHILPEVQAVCERVIVINRGKIVADGTPDQLGHDLTTDHRMIVRIEGPEREIAAGLRNVNNVTDVQMLGEKEPGVFEYSVEGPEGKDIRRDLFAFCSRKGAPLLAMRSTDLTLEEVFLHLTDESYMNRVKIRKTSPKAGTSAKEGESA